MEEHGMKKKLRGIQFTDSNTRIRQNNQLLHFSDLSIVISSIKRYFPFEELLKTSNGGLKARKTVVDLQKWFRIV